MNLDVTIDPANHPRREDNPRDYGYRPTDGERRPCLGCGAEVAYDARIRAWWAPFDSGNRPAGTATCPHGGRHLGSLPRVTPEALDADPVLRGIADMVAYMNLHIGKYQITQMTTEQKEWWTDLVDANAVLDARDDPTYLDPDGICSREPRWWRADYAGATGPEDPRWNLHHAYEPDPFAPDAEPLDPLPHPRSNET